MISHTVAVLLVVTFIVLLVLAVFPIAAISMPIVITYGIAGVIVGFIISVAIVLVKGKDS